MSSSSARAASRTSDAGLVYRGIALHFGKAQDQPEPEVRLIQIGAGIDLFSKKLQVLGGGDFPTQGEINRIAKALPRHRFKTAFLEEQRAHVARTRDPGPIVEWLVRSRVPASPPVAGRSDGGRTSW